MHMPLLQVSATVVVYRKYIASKSGPLRHLEVNLVKLGQSSCIEFSQFGGSGFTSTATLLQVLVKIHVLQVQGCSGPIAIYPKENRKFLRKN